MFIILLDTFTKLLTVYKRSMFSLHTMLTCQVSFYYYLLLSRTKNKTYFLNGSTITALPSSSLMAVEIF